MRKNQALKIALLILGMVSNARAVPLQKALEEGRVKVSFKGIGVSSGDSIIMRASNKTSKPLLLEVVPGTVLVSRSTDVENMVLRKLKGASIRDIGVKPVKKILLEPRGTESYFLEAYSMDLYKKDTDQEDAFTLGDLDPDLNNLMEAARVLKSSVAVAGIQVAVWAFSGNLSEAEIQKKFPVTQDEVGAARTVLRGSGAGIGRLVFFSPEERAAVLLERADALYDRREYTEAMEELRQAILIGPASQPVLDRIEACQSALSWKNEMLASLIADPSPEATDGLKAMLDDPESRFRTEAAKELEKRGVQPASPSGPSQKMIKSGKKD